MICTNIFTSSILRTLNAFATCAISPRRLSHKLMMNMQRNTKRQKESLYERVVSVFCSFPFSHVFPSLYPFGACVYSLFSFVDWPCSSVFFSLLFLTIILLVLLLPFSSFSNKLKVPLLMVLLQLLLLLRSQTLLQRPILHCLHHHHFLARVIESTRLPLPLLHSLPQLHHLLLTIPEVILLVRVKKI